MDAREALVPKDAEWDELDAALLERGMAPYLIRQARQVMEDPEIGETAKVAVWKQLAEWLKRGSVFIPRRLVEREAQKLVEELMADDGENQPPTDPG